MVEVLESGATVAVVTDDEVPAGRPIMPRDKPTPIRSRDPDTPPPPPSVRTWLALTVVDEDGHGYAGTRWTLTTPDGDDRTMELDASSSWRADELAVRGTCGEGLVVLPFTFTGWFRSLISDLRLRDDVDSVLELDGVGRWERGDPLLDYDGAPLPTVPGTPIYPGGDQR